MKLKDLPPAARKQAEKQIREQRKQQQKSAKALNNKIQLAKPKSKPLDGKALCFTIPFPQVTKKNSRIPRIEDGEFKGLLQSKQYQKYEKICLDFLAGRFQYHIDYPVNVKALYYVKPRRRVDKTNLESALLDILVAAGVLADDSAIFPEIVKATDGSRVYHDPDNPRTEVIITEFTEP